MEEIRFMDTSIRNRQCFIKRVKNVCEIAVIRKKKIYYDNQQIQTTNSQNKISGIHNLASRSPIKGHRKHYAATLQQKYQHKQRSQALSESITKSKQFLVQAQIIRKKDFFNNIIKYAHRMSQENVEYSSRNLGVPQSEMLATDFTFSPKKKKIGEQIVIPELNNIRKKVSEEEKLNQSTHFDRRQDQPLKSSLSDYEGSNIMNKKKPITVRQIIRTHKYKPKSLTFTQNYKEIQEQQRKMKLSIRKQIQLEYVKPFNPPTNITATQYIIFQPDFSERKDHKETIFNMTNNIRLLKQIKQFKTHYNKKQHQSQKYPHSNKVILSNNSKTMVEVASLTKIMTCILAIDLAVLHRINIKAMKVVIGKFEAKIGGTSAELSQNQVYTVEDLLYGLMLPSGNDASVAIAVFFGRLLLDEGIRFSNGEQFKKNQCYARFITEMNIKARELGMCKTNYANSHGLSNSQNRSCAFDLAILCEYAMKNDKFKEIVNTKYYEASVQRLKDKMSEWSDVMLGDRIRLNKSKSKNQERDNQIRDQPKYLQSNEDNPQSIQNHILGVHIRKNLWENTHKLLHSNSEEYIGIKTGITPTAGPCLASCVRAQNNRFFIIIVLCCDKMASRFKDTQVLKKWVLEKESLNQSKKSPRKSINKVAVNLSQQLS